MNRAQFFNTVKLARVPVFVSQDGDKGFKLTAAVEHEGEEKVEIGLLYKNEPRYFKSLNSVGDIMREYGIKDFHVNITKDLIATRKNAPRAKTEAGAPATAKTDKPATPPKK